MLAKISESLQLYLGNLPMLAALVFTVNLPLNFGMNYYSYFVNPEMDDLATLRMYTWLGTIFQPLVLAMVVHALNRSMSTRKVSYFDALEAGFKNWLPLFLTNLVANILICLGLIALIIPGIVLSIRYAFLHCAVVVDGKRGSDARKRSWTLTKGCTWQVLAIGVCFIGSLFVLSILAYIPIELMENVNAKFVLDLSTDCIVDLFTTYFVTLIFVFYWHAKAVYEPVVVGFEPIDSIAAIDIPHSPIVDDGNPYRPPQNL